MEIIPWLSAMEGDAWPCHHFWVCLSQTFMIFLILISHSSALNTNLMMLYDNVSGDNISHNTIPTILRQCRTLSLPPCSLHRLILFHSFRQKYLLWQSYHASSHSVSKLSQEDRRLRRWDLILMRIRALARHLCCRLQMIEAKSLISAVHHISLMSFRRHKRGQRSDQRFASECSFPSFSLFIAVT